MQVPARSFRQNLIHPPIVKRVYSECSPLIQPIALINNLKADENDTILMMIESKVINSVDLPSMFPGYI